MRGHLVIADISGYTRFLTESELDHAHGIITELLNAIIGAIKAPLTVSSVEGDAVFLYGVLPDDVYGQTVLESVENLYCSFASALETMVLNTTCRCNACANINALGLKIVMHCGEFMSTSVGDREMLTGPAVIAVHRLLKNHIREEVGIADYLMVTQDCVDDLDLARMVGGWTRHTEEYEHIGEVTGYVSSLPDVWEFVRSQTENKVGQAEAWITQTTQSVAPPAVVWDHFIDPIKRTKWLQANDNTVVGDVSGRVGPGTEYHCAHGEDNDVVVFTVLDLRTQQYMTTLMPLMPGVTMRFTDYLVPSGGGTRIVSCVEAPIATETGRPATEHMGPDALEMITANTAGYQSRLAAMADAAAEQLTTA